MTDGEKIIKEMSKLDNRKIAFIICSNNEQKLGECGYYLNHLKVPEGFRTDIVVVTQACSMAAGYNEGMDANDARYKIYLHQDVFILDENFLENIIQVFESDDNIGMLGVIGRKRLPNDALQIMKWDVGKILHNCFPYEQIEWQDDSGEYTEVEAVDGLLIATQYDVRWRDDVFTGWDFYDISQCCEFRNAGMKVVVPWQDSAWCYHDNHAANMKNYAKYRDLFKKEYWGIQIQENNSSIGKNEYSDIMDKVAMLLDNIIKEKKFDQLGRVFENPENRGHLRLKEYELLSKICKDEEKELGKSHFCRNELTKKEIFQQLYLIKCLVKRVEFAVGEAEEKKVNIKLLRDNFSQNAIDATIDLYSNPKEKERIKKIFEEELLC